MSQVKVLVVALDAAEPSLLLQWAREGDLPHFARLLETGAWTTTVGPLGMFASGVWQSLATGVSPAKHGHHGAFQIRPGTYQLYRATPATVKRDVFWKTLGARGHRAAVIDVPYLPFTRDFDGIHVVDWTTHSSDSGFRTWPENLQREISGRFGGDTIGLCDHAGIEGTEGFTWFRDQLIRRIATKTEMCLHYLQQSDWDLFLTTFGESHCVGHQAWHLHDPAHPRHDPTVALAVGDPLRVVYRALDGAIGRLLDSVGPETRVYALSSHGMGPYYNGEHLFDEILLRLGHRAPRANPRRQGSAWGAIRRLWRLLPKQARERLTPLQKAAIDRVLPRLDPQADCFNVPNGEVWGAIRVNLAGREPCGKIQRGAELDSFFDTLRRDLLALRNAETGDPVVLRVLRTAEIDDGPYLDHLPDILVEWNTAAPVRVIESERTGTIRGELQGPRTGHHTPNGIIFASGAGIPAAQIKGEVPVTSIPATIAAALGEQLPGLDGQPIAELATRLTA